MQAEIPIAAAPMTADRRLRDYAILTLLCLLLFGPGLAGIPVLDRDEARYVDATGRMVETGEILDVRYSDGETRYRKPHGIYWAQAVSVALFGGGDDVWPYRLPSALGAWLAVLLTYGIGRRAMSGRAGLLGGALLASSFMLIAEAHQAKTDALLLAAIVAAQAVLARCYLAPGATAKGATVDDTGADDREGDAPGTLAAALFWLAVLAGALIKGPVILLFVGASAATLSVWHRDLRWLQPLRPAFGLMFLVAALGIWAFAVDRATDGAFFATALGLDFLGKATSGQESHGAPPGTHLAMLSIGFAPASLFLPLLGVYAWRHRASRAVRFCLAWAVPAWLVFEVAVTKLPNYLLPAYPALALLAGQAVVTAAEARSGWLRSTWMRAYAVVWAAGFGALGYAAWTLPDWLDSAPAGASIATGSILGAGAVALLACVWTGRGRAAVAAAALTAALTIVAASMLLPKTAELWISPRLADMIEAVRDPGDAIMTVAYGERSLDFALDGTYQTGRAWEAAALLAGAENAVAIVSSRRDNRFRAAVERENIAVCVVAAVDGFHYVVGRFVVIRAYRTGAYCDQD